MGYSKATWEELGKDCAIKGAEEAIQSYEDLRKKMDPKKIQKKRGKPSRSRPTANVSLCWLDGGVISYSQLHV